MKKVMLSLALAVLTTVSAYAQLSEGSVSYTMSFDSDDPEMAMAVGMMAGSTMNLYFQENASRAEVHMGTMMNMTTISNSKSEEFLMLMDISMMNMKNAVRSTLSELEALDEESKPNYELSLEDETKKILGYKCKKAILTDEDGNISTFWYTEDIEVNKRGQNYLNEEVPGFPLEYEILQGGMKITIAATEFKDKLKNADGLFDLTIPEGYEEKTMDEMMGMGM